MIISAILNKFPEYREELVFGLAFGLVFGLVFGLAYGLASGLIFGLVPLWILLLAVIAGLEILFWLDSSKPKKNENKFWFALKRKAEAGFESLVIIVNAVNLVWLGMNAPWDEITPGAVQWLGYIGIAVVSIAVIALFVWLNSLRYTVKSKKK